MTNQADFTPEMIADPELYGDVDRLQAFYAWLRQENPVAWAEPEWHRPFWIVTKHDDIREIEKQPEVFKAGPRNTLVPMMVEEANKALFGIEGGFRMLVNTDGERHKDLRQITQDYFLPKNIRNLQGLVEKLAAGFVDRILADDAPDDIAADVIFWYPLRVAMTILGIGEADEARMLKLTHELFGSSDPAVRRPGLNQSEHLIEVRKDYMAFFEAVNRDRLANPREDVATLIAQGIPGDDKEAVEERLGYYVIIATAGHDTTAASIAGGCKALIDDPSLFEALENDPSLIKPFANEAIRYTAPVKHFFRNLAEDYELRGKTLKAGDTVLLSYGAACRDEDVFEAPQEFRIDRKANNHLAFGYGPHQCLGQYLAKLEIEAFFQELVSRCDGLEQTGAALYTEACFVSGLRSLPAKATLPVAA